MNRIKLGRFGVLFLAFMLFVGGVPLGLYAIAASWIDITNTVPEGAEIIAEQEGYMTTTLWHFSGGYWARTASDPIRISDSQLKGNIETLNDLIANTIEFEFALPQAVQTAITQGKKIGVCVTTPHGYDYFNTARGKPQTKIESSKLLFKAYPKFHFVPTSRYSYGDFVNGLNAFIPFVDPKYGHNGYALYSLGGSHVGAAAGYFDPDNPTHLGPDGTIHPTQILNSSGALKPGFTVSQWVDGVKKEYDSGNVKIGSGTFVNAGAVGLIFGYQLFVTYYEIDDTDVAVTAITPTIFLANKSVVANVTVKNLGSNEVTAPVTFHIPDITDGRQNVTLKPEESKTLTFIFTSPKKGTFPMTAEINPDRTFTESDYTNNILTVTGQVAENNDVAVTKIEKTSYPATSAVTADVTVENLGADSITTPVDFTIPGITAQSKEITLAPGQSRILRFNFSTPSTGPITMTAEANRNRVFTETNYANNKLTVTAQIVPIPVGSTSCSDTITWNEFDQHWVSDWYWCSFCQMTHDNSFWCYHTFTYETKLTATHNIDPKTLKSGYGFTVTVNNTISTRMISNQGCGSWGHGRANTQKSIPPDKTQVKLGWTCTNRRGTQPSTVDLSRISLTATQSKFEPKSNPISEIGAKLIYTDVALAGTKQSPKQHQLIIAITGGGVNGIPFCKEITDRITINGNMYKDDDTGHN